MQNPDRQFLTGWLHHVGDRCRVGDPGRAVGWWRQSRRCTSGQHHSGGGDPDHRPARGASAENAPDGAGRGWRRSVPGWVISAHATMCCAGGGPRDPRRHRLCPDEHCHHTCASESRTRPVGTRPAALNATGARTRQAGKHQRRAERASARACGPVDILGRHSDAAGRLLSGLHRNRDFFPCAAAFQRINERPHRPPARRARWSLARSDPTRITSAA